MTAQKYKATGNRGLFDEQNTSQKLSDTGNSLENTGKVIDFEIFREFLEASLLNTNKKNNAGAKPFDLVMMFKIMILQRYYGLGDTQIECQIPGRLSFKKFLGLESGDKVPDEKTVWAFREKLTNNGLVEDVFSQLTKHLELKGLLINEGKMGDASFTVAPRQRNTRDENKKIKQGNGDELWNDKPNKKKHKDADARWTKKNGETFFGYKNHAKVDTKSKHKEKLKTRARVEHVFGFMEQSMNGLTVKSVEIKRASGIIGLINLTYNLFRYEQVIRINII
ncbi:MAG: transposase [Bacteroidetes bacterium]|nr:transposase [Bacteroidota bacterium]